MRTIKKSVLGGIAVVAMGVGLTFAPQVRANGQDHDSNMCMNHAVEQYQEAMEGCNTYGDNWERSHCREMAREEFEEARDMCKMHDDGQGNNNNQNNNHNNHHQNKNQGNNEGGGKH